MPIAASCSKICNEFVINKDSVVTGSTIHVSAIGSWTPWGYRPRVINIRHYVCCLALLRTISCLVACMYLCRREFIACPILPALSLHALSKLALFTCRFHYPRNPYDVLYTLFPLPAQSIPPK